MSAVITQTTAQAAYQAEVKESEAHLGTNTFVGGFSSIITFGLTSTAIGILGKLAQVTSDEPAIRNLVIPFPEMVKRLSVAGMLVTYVGSMALLLASTSNVNSFATKTIFSNFIGGMAGWVSLTHGDSPDQAILKAATAGAATQVAVTMAGRLVSKL